MFLAPGEVGGSEPLLTNLVSALADTDNQIFVFALKGLGAAYPEIAAKTDLIEVPWRRNSQVLRIGLENTWLAMKARRLALDVMHHGVGTTPYLKPRPAVVTIHDIQYVHYPDNFVKLKRQWLKRNVPFTARSCEAITVPSRWVKRDIERSFGISGDKIVVVPFGSENLFGRHPSSAEDVRSRYSLDRPFFLFPGRTYPHKNHRFLVEAFGRISGTCDLIFTGAPWFRDKEIEAAARHMNLTGRVRHLGLVPRADLAGLYSAATALAYPTRFEGFGAPVIEAMSLGCPVIASDVTAVPEVAGDAGILLEPDDLAGWSDTMERLLTDEHLRSELAARGHERALMFSWKHAAELQLDAYRMAIG